jgi:hypothetical protein
MSRIRRSKTNTTLYMDIPKPDKEEIKQKKKHYKEVAKK